MSDSPLTEDFFKRNPSPEPWEVRTFMQELEEKLSWEIAELKAWKESAMAVEKEWDPMWLARQLNVPLGTSARAGIQDGVSKLLAKVELMRVAGNELKHDNETVANLRRWDRACQGLA